ncbi:MAG TPA: hypothetical protein VK550_07850 [Polyangiaceae bacterium]|nr:hypothetical protein [Polyangiaceae bacterium]
MIRAAGLGSLLLTCVSIVGSGCLDRPVAPAVPEVTARVMEQVKQNKVNKIDLLFMIDNSSSMADKQAILGDAVPELVKRLIEPKCVDKDTGEIKGNAVNSQCPVGVLDFEPIKDIHIGIVSSSLGSHGAGGTVCDDPSDMTRSDPHNNDRGHLVSRAMGMGTVPTFKNKGFLLYNPSVADGLKSSEEVAPLFKSMVTGVGQHGCGYEASLEAVYRFLVDPEPFNTISRAPDDRSVVVAGIDQELLAQRAEFLRADSLVSVMIVTDENDCSIADVGQGFFPLLNSPTGASQLARSTSACDANPNDQCCFNCGVTNPPANCIAPKDDAQCGKAAKTLEEDPPNLRCFNQKQKYGQDFLYPVQRYIDGFGSAKIRNRKGEEVDNPLFSDLSCKPGTACQQVRDKSLVFVAGITGVPWQLIAKNSNDLGEGYKTAKEILEQNLWLDLVGDPENPKGPVLPGDAHMVESIAPRPNLAPPSSGAKADPIHGHEWNPSEAKQRSADLQYACTFALPPTGTKMCTSDDDCDCAGTQDELDKRKSPLCQNQTTNAFSITQVRAKAYPGTRILQVLKGLDPEQAIVASICPSQVTNPGAKDYGYTPAIQALISRLRTVLRGRCMPRALEVDPDSGLVPCAVIESYESHGACDCKTLPGRTVADPKLVTTKMREVGDCFCEMDQIQDAREQDLCKTNPDPGSAGGNGWCYIDPAHGKDGKADVRQCGLVAKCPDTERRLIKFVNATSEPRSGAVAFIMCQEKAFEPSAGRGEADVCQNN